MNIIDVDFTIHLHSAGIREVGVLNWQGPFKTVNFNEVTDTLEIWDGFFFHFTP